MSSADQILDRIRKLLRMQRGGTPEEVATALRLAQKLADEHGIDLSSVRTDEQADRAVDAEATEPKSRLQWECIYASQIIQGHFNVRSIIWKRWTGTCVRIIGTKLDRQIALYVYHFLTGHFRREWKENRGRCRNRRAFMYGMLLGLDRKLRDQRKDLPTDNPLAVAVQSKAAACDAWVEANCGPLQDVSIRPDSNAQAAMTRGWKAGRRTEIRPGVERPTVAGHLPAPAEVAP